MSNQDKKSHTLVIGDECLERLGVNMAFASENTLLMFPSNKREQDIRNLKNNGKLKSTLYEVQWNTFLHNQHTRKLLNESHGIFTSLQKTLEDTKDEQKKKEIIVSGSRKYRSVVSVCQDNIQNAAETANTDDLKVEYTSQSELFSYIEIIWSLAEILFIDSASGEFVLPQLLEWVRWHSGEGHKRVIEAMSYETITTQSVYWEAVYFFVLQGNLENARKLLKRNQEANRDDFLSMDELLRKMPVYQNGKSVSEFGPQWKRWQEQCVWRLESGEFSALSELEVLAKILCGDRATISSYSFLCEAWYHTMVSWLLYTNPCIKGKELGSIVGNCWEWFKGSEVMTVLDQILTNIFSYHFTQVLIELCYFPDSWWFVAHLCDLLYHNKQLKFDSGHSLENPKSLRELLIINFASCLMTHSSLWQIGVDYLDTCGEKGRNILESYLERIPLTTHTKALGVLHVAEKRDMKSLVFGICMVLARQASANNQIGTALTWAIRAGDSACVSHLADRFLQEYCDKGQFTSLDLLDSLGSSMLVSDRLTFLGKYREFHRLHENEQYKMAADLLISLLASNLAPKYFWMTLLLDSVPLLESENLIFSSQQTHQLLYSLQELNPTSSEKIQMLRLSLAKNLERAFIEESSVV